jgi:hypothetical protein
MSAIVVLTESLFPAMLLHAVADITSVSCGYVVCAEDREAGQLTSGLLEITIHP